MKKLLLLAIFCSLGFGEFKLTKFELETCALYNEAGKARFEKRIGEAKFLEDRLTNRLGIIRTAISSCPKEFQEYGWYAEPREPRDHDREIKIR